jgi:hypothetical protein
LSLIAIDSKERTLTALVLENLKTPLSETRVADRTGDHAGRACCTCCTCSTRRTGCACRGWACRRAMRCGASRRLRSHRCILQTFGEARKGHFCRENEAMDPKFDSAQFLSLEVRARFNRELRFSVASQGLAHERGTQLGASGRREMGHRFVRVCDERAPSPDTLRDPLWVLALPMAPELDSAQFLSLEVRARFNRELRFSVASQGLAHERVPSLVHQVAVKRATASFAFAPRAHPLRTRTRSAADAGATRDEESCGQSSSLGLRARARARSS